VILPSRRVRTECGWRNREKKLFEFIVMMCLERQIGNSNDLLVFFSCRLFDAKIERGVLDFGIRDN
jgi:hypothetical protein